MKYKNSAPASIARLYYAKMNSNTCITTDTKEFIWSSVHQTYTMERFDFVKPLTHEKHCIQISKHVTNYGKIMHMEKKKDKWRKSRR
ncbi:hypothetical protein T09_2919 [Trichinella sp. T9]|nr:hypothetical protein T09_2919 [Trichinella sp. T9]